MYRLRTIMLALVLLVISNTIVYGYSSDCCYDSYDSSYYSSAEYALSNIDYSIENGDEDLLKEYINKYETYRFKDGKIFLQKVFEKCISLAKKDSVKIRNIKKALKIVFKKKIKCKRYLRRIMLLEDYRESIFLGFCIKNGLRDKKTITKVVSDAIKNKKGEVLKVVLKSGIKLKKSLMKKMKWALKNINIIVLHTKVLRDLKALFKKKDQNKDKKKVKKEKKKKNKQMTQMESFLKVWFNKKGKVKDYGELIERLIKENYCSGYSASIDKKDIDLYVNILKSMNEKEREHSDYYAFYHGHSNDVGFIFDLQTSIRKWFQLEKRRYKDVYMRFKTTVDYKSIKDFMNFYDGYGWHDLSDPLQSQVLSVNFVPYGNTGNSGSSTLEYFAKGYSMATPGSIVYNLFKDLGFDKKYIDKLYDVYEDYMVPKKGGHLLQIFIPKDKVDDFVYLSKILGVPYRDKIVGIKYNKKKGRHKSTFEYLNKYIKDPFCLKTRCSGAKYIINSVQGRIVFMPNFYTPESGVKIVRYNFISEDKKKQYKKEFEKVIDEMMSDWIEKEGHEKLKESGRNKKMLRLLRYLKKALKA